MVPTLEAGERLICLAIPRRFVLTLNSVVVVRDPRDRRNLLIKRIKSIEPDGSVVVIGDNEAVSIDSRNFGSIRAAEVEGRALFVYSPSFFSLSNR